MCSIANSNDAGYSIWVPAFAGMTVLRLVVNHCYSTALTIASITFFASPNTIMVFGW
jgi:hypothetical protein